VPEPKETREGEGRYEWRPLASNERIQEGDQYLDYDNGHKQNWRQVPAIAVGELVENTPIRRRAPAPQPPAEQVPSVDIVRHEREELRKANAELPERFKDAEHERDLYKKQFTHALHCVNTAFQDDYKDECILPDYLRIGDCKFTGVIRLAKDFQRLQDERDQLEARCKELEKEIEIEDVANQNALKSVMNERDQLRTQLAQWQGASKELDKIVMEEISEREASHDLLDDIASTILCEEVNWTFHNLKWREALEVAKSMRFERSKLLAELNESRNELATAKAEMASLTKSAEKFVQESGLEFASHWTLGECLEQTHYQVHAIHAELAKLQGEAKGEGWRGLLTTLMHRAYMRLDYREADEIANFLGVPSPIVHEMQDL
jgi:DNA repair exonuclease SbcCD ATPase subunit